MRRLFRLATSRRASADGDVDAEIQVHLELRAEALVRAGLQPKVAEDESRRRFGDVASARVALLREAEVRDRTLRTRQATRAVIEDTRFALRSLRSDRVFVTAIVATLAIAIGAVAVIHGLADRILFGQLAHVRDPSGLARVFLRGHSDFVTDHNAADVPYALFNELRGDTLVLDGLTAITAEVGVVLGRGDGARRVRARYVEPEFFTLLGTRPALGRFFDQVTVPRPVVLSHATWQREYGRDSSILHRPLFVDGAPATVIGVAPRGFTGVQLEGADLWMPIEVMGSRFGPSWAATWNSYWVQLVARVKPSVTPGQAAQWLTHFHQTTYHGSSPVVARATLVTAPIHADDSGAEPIRGQMLRLLLSVGAVVLAIACATVVNLVLARALRRREDLAIRAVLGAGRSRLIRLVGMEGVVLAALSGAAALVLGAAGTSLARRYLLPDVEWTRGAVGLPIAGASIALAIAAGFLVVLVTGLTMSRFSVIPAVHESQRRSGRGGRWWRDVVVAVHTALAVLLVAGAGQFLHSIWRIESLDLGLEPDQVLAVTAQWPRAEDMVLTPPVAEVARRDSVLQRALPAVRSLPDVVSATRAIGVPLRSSMRVALAVPGRDSLPALPGGGPYIVGAGNGYFETVGTPIRRGRAFGPADSAGGARVAIVNETMARALWPDTDPLGQCVLIGSAPVPCARIVGVASDTRRWNLTEPPAMQYYVPVGQEALLPWTSILVRPRPGARDLPDQISRAVRAADQTVSFVDVRPLSATLEPDIRPFRLGAWTLACCSLLALAVAVAGMYGVVAYTSTHRVHEIGIRLALGASPAAVAWLVMQRSVRMAVLGAVLGIGVVLAAAPIVQPLLFDTSARDPRILVAVVVLVVAVATAAAMFPALTTRRLSPLIAVRNS